MDTKTLLERYEGRPLDIENLSTFEKWALDYFENPKNISDPTLEITLELDITAANDAYRKRHASTEGSSFTAYLTYTLFKTLGEHYSFKCRFFDNKWYIFDNPPLIFPVATGGSERFSDVLIENVHTMDWSEFCNTYRKKVDKARADNAAFEQMSDGVWYTGYFIGNLPNLRFTGMKVHEAASKTGSPFFYFGKRFERDGKLFVSLYAMMDHRIADFYVLGKLIEDFEARLVE